MATTYITDAALKTAVANRLGSVEATLYTNADHLVEIVTTANQEAYRTIRRKLVARGFTIAQIDAWDDAAKFNRKIAVCYALREMALMQTMDMKALDVICNCVEELEEVPVLNSGVEQDPTGGHTGILTGDLERDDDVFTLDMEL